MDAGNDMSTLTAKERQPIESELPMTMLVGSQRRWAVPVAIAVALAAVAGFFWQRGASSTDTVDGSAWEWLGGGSGASYELRYDSLDDIAPGSTFVTPDGVHAEPADVVVRGKVVDVRPSRAYVSPPDPNGTIEQEVPYELAPPMAAKIVRLIVGVDEVVAGSLPDGVEDQVGIEVLQPEGISLDELREKFTQEGSGVYFLRDYRAFQELRGVPAVVPTPAGVYGVMGNAVFVDDGHGGVKAPYLTEDEAEMLLGPAATLNDLVASLR